MKKILIIEDDTFLNDLESKKLTSDGYAVFNANSSEEAEAELEKNTPDIVLLDLMFPGIDGFAMLEKIKKGEKTKDVPVLVFSNLSSDADISRAKELGAKEFIIKSNFTLDEVADKIKSIIGN
jgi:two-component system, OmpR family, alkaline phosphatase synthesis response regulator PhoP